MFEDLLGNAVTDFATPAIGGIVGNAASDVVGATQGSLLDQLTKTTAGALTGAGTGALIGLLTGGKSGAMGGALTGGIGGGLGGYKSNEVLQSLGMGQNAGASQGGQSPAATRAQLYNGTAFDPNQTLVQPTGGMGPGAPGKGFMGVSPDTMSALKNLGGLPAGNVSSQMANAQNPLEAAGQSPATPQSQGDYIDFLKNNKAPLELGFYGGTAADTMNRYNQSTHNYNQANTLSDLINQQRNKAFSQSLFGVPGRAEGGPVTMSPMQGMSMSVPPHVQKQVEGEGGIAALQQGMNLGMATGGYVNTTPFNPNSFYPQSRIQSAQPYAGAAQPRMLNTIANGASFAHGGLINGPGDGMSDDIPANIEGREPVKVADGEYVIPKHIAEKHGIDKLKKMHDMVREASHAKKGEQIVQDAGKRAFIRALSGVRA